MGLPIFYPKLGWIRYWPCFGKSGIIVSLVDTVTW